MIPQQAPPISQYHDYRPYYEYPILGARSLFPSTNVSVPAPEQLPANLDPSATLSRPFNGLHLEEADANYELVADSPTVKAHISEEDGHAAQAVGGNLKTVKRKNRRGKKKKDAVEGYGDQDSSPEATTKTPIAEDAAHVVWRKTPILQEPAHPFEKSQRTPGLIEGKIGHAAAASAGRQTRHERALRREMGRNSGWTTEATDVQEMGDFDFAANLSKFDKKSVWEELRNEDTTADEDRLVSFNRVKPLPGTFGGQKLHPTENVLSRKSTAGPVARDSDSDLDANPGGMARRKLLQRDSSRGSVQKAPSRKNSVRPAAANGTSRSLSHQRLADHVASNSWMQPQASSTSSVFSPSQPSAAGRPSLRYVTSGRVCRTVSPETLQAVETLAHDGLGMSDDLLAENAGRGIAEVVISAIDPGGHRIGHDSHNALPVVVMLVGENKAGARALAAARHLLERNVRVIASLTGALNLENGPLSAQVQRFRGKVLQSWPETSAHLKTLDAPPELIVDALLGLGESFEDLQPGHFDTAMDMVGWANKSRASVLSIDIPSGVDGATGAVQIREGEPLEVRSRIVVCCGIPCTGLLEAMIARDEEAGMRVSVVDIGINPAARPFLKMNTNQKEGQHKGKFVQFGAEWVVAVAFDAGISAS